MGRRKTFTDNDVAKLKPRRKRYNFPDPETPSLYIRVTPGGAKSFCVVYRKGDSQKWVTIGSPPTYNIDLARKRAGEILRSAREGKSEPDSFERTADQWRKLHCEARKLRSLSEIDRHLKRMKDAWTGRAFNTVGRGDVAKLLDKIETKNGARQATYCLQVFSALANWYAARDDAYRSPLVKGMRRGSPVKRDRILDDDELRAVWTAAEANGSFGALVRLLLLTAQRREKVASMKWEDISAEGVWTIATEAREKGNARELVLPDAALEIIKTQPRFESNPYVFAGRGNAHFGGYSKAKAAFDAKVKSAASCGFAPWRLHDLRRTAKSLMARAGIRPDISERVLGHTIQGVEGVYDRHSYRDEKAFALNKLASLIEGIVHPTDKVTRLRA
jgi:integrase